MGLQHLQQVLYARGYQMAAAGQWDSAAEAFCFLCSIYGDQSRNWLGLGACLRELKDHTRAIAAFEIASDLAPDVAAPYFQKLLIFMHQENWRGAQEALVKFDAVSCAVEDADLLTAIAPLRKALELRSNSLIDQNRTQPNAVIVI